MSLLWANSLPLATMMKTVWSSAHKWKHTHFFIMGKNNIRFNLPWFLSEAEAEVPVANPIIWKKEKGWQCRKIIKRLTQKKEIFVANQCFFSLLFPTSTFCFSRVSTLQHTAIDQSTLRLQMSSCGAVVARLDKLYRMLAKFPAPVYVKTLKFRLGFHLVVSCCYISGL